MQGEVLIGVCIRERKTETSADRQTDRQAGRHGRGLLHTQKDNGWAEGPMYYSKHLFSVYGQYSVVLFSIRKHNGIGDNI